MPQKKELISEIKRRFATKFLDILVLTIIRFHPMWGYKLIAEIKRDFGVKIGYGTMYPLLNSLENEGLIRGTLRLKGQRKRKVYEITPRGAELIKAYNEFLREQTQMTSTIF